MAQDKPAPNERLRQLQDGFLERTGSEIAELEELCSSEGTDQLEALSGIERIAHRISGGGGTFGFPELSAAAEVLEQAAEQAQNHGDKAPEDMLPLVSELRRVHKELSAR